MKRYSPTGRRNRGRPLKRLLDTWDRNGSTRGLTPWQTCDDDDDDDDDDDETGPIFIFQVWQVEQFILIIKYKPLKYIIY